MSNRKAINGLILGMLAFVGCSDENPPQSVPVVQPVEKPLPPAPEILPGDRPKSIRGARFFVLSDFITAERNKELSRGDLVCVEGPVAHAGERMGAAYLTMNDSNNEQVFSCEGDGLHHFRFTPGKNVLVHGKFDNGSMLVQASLITQREVDRANAEEKP